MTNLVDGNREQVRVSTCSNFVHVLGSNHPILALIKMQFPIRWHRGVGQHSAAAVKGPRVAVAAGGENHIDVRLAAGLLKLEGHNG